jgi:hypothetical protein
MIIAIILLAAFVVLVLIEAGRFLKPPKDTGQ